MKYLPRLLAVCLAALALLPAQDAAPPSGALALEPAEPVVVFLVRHAEKGADDPRDPGLTDAGRARAAELARVLGDAGVTHLFATEYRRTQETLLPLAERVDLEVEVVGARTFDRQVERLLALEPGSVAVVAGHSNTVPLLAARLTMMGPEHEEPVHTETLGEDEYDALIQVVLPPASHRTGATAVLPKSMWLHYGRGAD